MSRRGVGIVATILAKDLRLGVRDRSVLVFGLAVPLGLALVLNLVFGGLGDGAVLTGSRLGVVDADGGGLSGQLVGVALPQVTAELGMSLHDFDDEDAAALAVEAGEVDAAIVVPAGFSAAAEVSGPGTLRVVRNADRQLVGDVAQAIAEQFATRTTGTQVAVAAALSSGVSGTRAGEVAALASQLVSPVQLVTAGVDDRELDSTTYLTAGMLVFFLFFTVQFGVLGFLQERQDGTLPRLLSGPLTPWHVVAAKVGASFVVGVASVMVFMLAATVLMGADYGPWVPAVLLGIAAVASAVGLVAVAASIARTSEQAGNVSSIIAIVLGMLGGSFFPVDTGPGVLSTLSRATPHGQFLRGLGDLRADASLAAVVPSVTNLLVIGAVLLAVGAVALARREEW